jgi:hypothetical protein
MGADDTTDPRFDPMTRLARPLATFLALAALASLSAAPALAKEGAEARLDTAIPRDAEPGSTLEVGWSVFFLADGVEQPIFGSPVYVRLVSPDGSASSDVAGVETPPGSGHYEASIVVPEGGIGEVIVAMVGEACHADGRCERADYVFPLTDDALISGTAPAAGIDPAAATGSDGVAGVGSALLPLVAIGIAIALAAGLAALVAGRRRPMGTDPAGH